MKIKNFIRKNYSYFMVENNVLKSFSYIGGFWVLGELIRYLFDLLIPGSILGMLLIFISLRMKWIRLKDVKIASDVLLKYLALFFVPYGVGLMTYYNLIKSDLPVILFCIALSSMLSFYVTAILMQKYSKG